MTDARTQVDGIGPTPPRLTAGCTFQRAAPAWTGQELNLFAPALRAGPYPTWPRSYELGRSCTRVSRVKGPVSCCWTTSSSRRSGLRRRLALTRGACCCCHHSGTSSTGVEPVAASAAPVFETGALTAQPAGHVRCRSRTCWAFRPRAFRARAFPFGQSDSEPGRTCTCTLPVKGRVLWLF